MTRLTIAFIALAGSLGAQLAPPNENGMRMGHAHLNVRDIAAHKKFWVEQIGAKAIRVGKVEGVEIPGMILLFRKQEPTGTVAGSVIDHLGLKIRKLDDLIAKFKAAGSKVEEPRTGRENTPQTYVTGPDEFRMELVEDPKIDAPVVSHHLHYFLAEQIPVKAWYVKNLLVKPGMRGPYEAGDIPGMNLSFAPLRAGPTVATKGRVLDHVSFDVTDLKKFCVFLEDNGIKFETPYRKDPDLGLWTVTFTDPWGAYIELTEGLN